MKINTKLLAFASGVALTALLHCWRTVGQQQAVGVRDGQPWLGLLEMEYL
jgi:hypothetical protein